MTPEERHRRETELLLFGQTHDETQRRARAIPDPPGAFALAIAELRRLDAKLSRTAVATEMGIDRGTLSDYIVEGLVPEPPWEQWSPPGAGSKGR